MIEHVNLLIEQGLAVPSKNQNPNIDDLVKSRQTDLFENLQSTNSGTYKPENGEF